MIVSTSEQVKESINKKLLIFWRFQAYVKKIKCLFQWQEHESIFPTIGFFLGKY
jgi:hypothetical protein